MKGASSVQSDRPKQVQIIQRRRGVVLVEYHGDTGGVARCYIPNSVLSEDGQGHGYVDTGQLRMGIPFGADWESLAAAALEDAQVALTPRAICDALHRAGIWTLEDAQAGPADVQAAIVALAGPIVRGIIGAARRAGMAREEQ